VQPYALLIVLDGARVDEVTRNTTSSLTGVPGAAWSSELWEGMPDAQVVREAVAPGVTITFSAHADLLTGRVEGLGNLPIGEGPPDLYRPAVPTLPEAVRDQLGDTPVVLGNTEFLGPAAWSVTSLGAGLGEEIVVGDDRDVAGDEGVIAALEARIAEGPPRLAVVNLHEADRSGHFGAVGEYPDALAEAGGLLNGLFERLRASRPEYWDNLLLIVTSDHGRHRDTGEEEEWRRHGDSCAGCRQIPLFVTGPTVETPDPTLLVDLAPTVAGHLGVDLPFATGLALGGTPTGSGVADVAVGGGQVAFSRMTGDAAHRSEVVVGGDLVSSTDALFAEAPALAEGFVCWRELHLATAAEYWPWRPTCARRTGGTWESIGFPVEEAAPGWSVALDAVDGALSATWNQDVDGTASFTEGDEVGVWTATWSGAWSEPERIAAYSPAAPASAGGTLAFATNLENALARTTRRIRVVRDGVVTDLDPVSDLGRPARAERPAVRDDGAAVAALLIDERGSRILVSELRDGAWTPLAELPGDADPWHGPRWHGDEVVWASAGSLCRARPGDAEVQCRFLDALRIQSFAIAGDVAVAVRDVGTGQWGAWAGLLE
jgi:hypothetical protein